MKKIKLNKKNIFNCIIYLLLILFLLTIYYLYIPTGDDWSLGKGSFLDSLKVGFDLWKTYNGRLLGNAFAFLLNSNQIIRIIIQVILIFLTIFFINKFNKNKKLLTIFTTIFLFFACSHYMFREVITWVSGFGNYVIPPLMMLIYLYIIKNVFDDKVKKIKFNNYQFIICFLTGFFMNLFIEHSSIFSVILGIGVILVTYLLRKKVYKTEISFLIGSIIGCTLMFLSPPYLNGLPRMEGLDIFNTFNLLEKAIYNLKYSSFLSDLVFHNIFLNIVISLIFLFNFKNYKKVLAKVSSIILSILTIFIFPFYYIQKYIPGFLLNPKLEIFLIILFVIIVSYLLIVCFWNKKKKHNFLFLTSLFLSNFICAFPLLFAYDIGGRCFYHSYIILLLFTIILGSKLVKVTKIFNALSILGTLLITSILIFISVDNYKINNIRKDILKEASENNYIYITLPEYNYHIYIHHSGKPATVFHNIVFKRYYELNQNSIIKFVNYKNFNKYDNKNLEAYQTKIIFPTYDGSNQAVHPSVIFINNKYYAVFTPWPHNNNKYENPSIITSNDGIYFEVPEGIQNPIIGKKKKHPVDYYSDPTLVYINNQFQLFYRFNKYIHNNEISAISNNFLYRMTSNDGINYSNEELIFEDNDIDQYMSPSIVFENNKYKIFYVNYDNKIYLKESSDLKNFSEKVHIPINPKITVWHMEIKKTNLGYILLIYDNIKEKLYLSLSNDYNSFKEYYEIKTNNIKCNTGLKRVYKSSIVLKQKYAELYIPYSCNKTNNKWQMHYIKTNINDLFKQKI